MVILEVLDQLALVSAQRVRRREAQDSARPDEVENVDFTRQPVRCFVVDLHPLLALDVPRPLLDPTATAQSKPIKAYVLPVRELQRFSVQNDLLQLLLVILLWVVGALEFFLVLRV